MGAWLVHGFVASQLGLGTVPDLALRWRGATLDTFATLDGHVGLVWQVDWQGSEHAAQFAERVNATRAPNGGVWRATLDDTQSVLVAADTYAALEELALTAGGAGLPGAAALASRPSLLEKRAAPASCLVSAPSSGGI